MARNDTFPSRLRDVVLVLSVSKDVWWHRETCFGTLSTSGTILAALQKRERGV
jgi:hypothetical protein